MPGGSVEHWNEEAGRWMGASSPTSPGGLAQPDSREALGLHPFHRVGPQAPPRPHVSPDARGHRSRDARAGADRSRPRTDRGGRRPSPGSPMRVIEAHARDLQPRSPSGRRTRHLRARRRPLDGGLRPQGRGRAARRRGAGADDLRVPRLFAEGLSNKGHRIEGRQELPFLLAPLEEPRRGRAPRRAVPRFHAGAARSDRGLQPASPLSRRSARWIWGLPALSSEVRPWRGSPSSSAPSGAAIPAPR